MMKTNSKHDPFRIVFDVFQSSLSGATSVDCDKRSSTESSNNDDIFSSATEKELHQSVLSRLGNVKILRELTMQRLSSKLLLDTAKIGVIESSHCQAEANCLRHEELTKRRLGEQLLAAERSMRELVFEIIGEYGKSEVRISRRQYYLLNIAQLKLIRRISQLRWQRFSLRLCDSLSCRPPASCDQIRMDQTTAREYRITGKILCPTDDNLEITSIASSLGGILKKRSLQASPVLNILAVVKLSRVQYHQKKVRLSSFSTGSDCATNNSSPRLINLDGRAPMQRLISSHHRSEDALVISTPAEFQIIIDRLLKWIKDDDFYDVSLSKVDKTEFDSNKFLSSYHIAWLHPPSYYPMLWGKVASHGKHRKSVHEVPFADTYLSKTLNDVEGYPHSVPEADHNQRKSWEGQCLDDFISRYSLQHTSLLASDRIYFCLEERNLLTFGKFPIEDTLGESKSRERLTLELQSQLQVFSK